MTQDNLRNLYKDLHEQDGISYKYFSEKIGISKAYFSLWLHGNRNFSKEVFETAVSVYQDN